MADFCQLWLPKLLLDHANEFGKNEQEMIVNLTQFMPKHLRTYISTNLSMLDIRFHDNTYSDVKYLKENLTEQKNVYNKNILEYARAFYFAESGSFAV